MVNLSLPFSLPFSFTNFSEHSFIWTRTTGQHWSAVVSSLTCEQFCHSGKHYVFCTALKNVFQVTSQHVCCEQHIFLQMFFKHTYQPHHISLLIYLRTRHIFLFFCIIIKVFWINVHITIFIFSSMNRYV